MQHENVMNYILGVLSKIDPEERVSVIHELSEEICFQCGSFISSCYCEFED